jgi:hypothetical protein
VPRPPDCPPRIAYGSPTRLERIARELEAEPSEFRWWLRELVDQRSRERAAKHARAHGQLDKKIGVESVPVSVPDSPDLS